MQDRIITFPVPQTRKTGIAEDGCWGLAEFLVERALANPELLATSDTCDTVLALLPRLRSVSGATEPKTLRVSQGEWEFLRSNFNRALALIASQSGGVIPPHWIGDMAIYARALNNADQVPAE